MSVSLFNLGSWKYNLIILLARSDNLYVDLGAFINIMRGMEIIKDWKDINLVIRFKIHIVFTELLVLLIKTSLNCYLCKSGTIY
jgi:hypothetical protein